MNRKTFFTFIAFAFTFFIASIAFAQDGGESVASSGAMAAAIAIGLAAFGGAIGQGNAAAAALKGIARNPGSADQVFTPLLLGLAFIESLVIYALLIAFMIK